MKQCFAKAFLGVDSPSIALVAAFVKLLPTFPAQVAASRCRAQTRMAASCLCLNLRQRRCSQPTRCQSRRSRCQTEERSHFPHRLSFPSRRAHWPCRPCPLRTFTSAACSVCASSPVCSRRTGACAGAAWAGAARASDSCCSWYYHGWMPACAVCCTHLILIWKLLFCI